VKTVAVVDDEAPVRIALGRLLRLADYKVSAFASGEEFLASLTTIHPGCVLLDVHMPGLTGFDVIKRMRAAHIDIPVIFITASDARDIDQTASQCGARLLRKPFSNDVLLAAVEAVLQGGVGREGMGLSEQKGE
jgi:FixJ family two-component response regulator